MNGNDEPTWGDIARAAVANAARELLLVVVVAAGAIMAGVALLH